MARSRKFKIGHKVQARKVSKKPEYKRDIHVQVDIPPDGPILPKGETIKQEEQKIPSLKEFLLQIKNTNNFLLLISKQDDRLIYNFGKIIIVEEVSCWIRDLADKNSHIIKFTDIVFVNVPKMSTGVNEEVSKYFR